MDVVEKIDDHLVNDLLSLRLLAGCGNDNIIFILYFIMLTKKSYRRGTDGWFTWNQKKIEATLGLSPAIQKRCKIWLRKHRVLEECLSGQPAKWHYKVNLEALEIALMHNALTTRHEEGVNDPEFFKPSQDAISRYSLKPIDNSKVW